MKVQAGAYAVRSTRKRKCRVYTSTKGGYFVAHTPEKKLSLLPLLDEQVADAFDNKNLKPPIIEQVRQMLVNPGNPDVTLMRQRPTYWFMISSSRLKMKLFWWRAKHE